LVIYEQVIDVCCFSLACITIDDGDRSLCDGPWRQEASYLTLLSIGDIPGRLRNSLNEDARRWRITDCARRAVSGQIEICLKRLMNPQCDTLAE
jgi:hypothetical protein